MYLARIYFAFQINRSANWLI